MNETIFEILSHMRPSSLSRWTSTRKGFVVVRWNLKPYWKYCGSIAMHSRSWMKCEGWCHCWSTKYLWWTCRKNISLRWKISVCWWHLLVGKLSRHVVVVVHKAKYLRLLIGDWNWTCYPNFATFDEDPTWWGWPSEWCGWLSGDMSYCCLKKQIMYKF